MALQSSQQTVSRSGLSPKKFNEEILVVKRSHLFENQAVEGFVQGVARENVEHFEKVIRQYGEFQLRGLMEEDETYKQIIPYFVFTHNNKLFLMQRHKAASESRLASKYSLGIGGHINKADLVNGDIAAWGLREFHEEVAYTGKIKIDPLGIINDDSNPVGRVHMGVVYLVHGDTPDIAIKSELAKGALYSKEECEAFYDQMEAWTQMVFDTLKKARYI